MTNNQKEVQQSELKAEERVLKRLKQIYSQASEDCANKIAELGARTDLENIQSAIYQKQYQQALKSQIDSIYSSLHSDSFTTVSEYLTNCYKNGYAGTMYDLQSQSIPVITPIDQKQVVKAVQTNSKLSKSYYDALGEDVSKIKKSTWQQVARGIANGSSWNEVAQEIRNSMTSPTSKALYNAQRIARTEGHRIQNEATLDAMQAAVEKGADIVKQWDATLDGRTRPDHRMADGQIREIDEYFDVGGEKMKAPGVGGSARNVCNCRCKLLQRARWALDDEELKTLQKRAAYFGLDKTKDFEEYKTKYLNLPESAAVMAITVSSEALKLIDILEKNGVSYREVSMHDNSLSESEIIQELSGGDMTSGSCASVGLCYIGQKGGLDVLDFRDGTSRELFSQWGTLNDIANLPGVTTLRETARTTLTAANKLLKQVETDKEYYFVAGRHASIVRKTSDGVLQYLELQSASNSGWTDFDGNPRYTLSKRFGCSNSNRWSRYGITVDEEAMMIDVDSLKDSADLRKILGYINTATDKQKKGSGGYAK